MSACVYHGYPWHTQSRETTLQAGNQDSRNGPYYNASYEEVST